MFMFMFMYVHLEGCNLVVSDLLRTCLLAYLHAY